MKLTWKQGAIKAVPVAQEIHSPTADTKLQVLILVKGLKQRLLFKEKVVLINQQTALPSF